MTTIGTAKQRKSAAARLNGNSAPATRKFTVAEYYKLAEIGVLRPDERVELIEGEIIAMSPQGPKHASSNQRATQSLIVKLRGRATVRIQLPIHLTDDSEPEPDVVLAVPDANDYGDHHPTPPEILLVLEVADSTLKFDRGRKSRVYANAGIIQYCLLNLKTRELVEHRQPGSNGYRSKKIYAEHESFRLAALPAVAIKVADLLPMAARKR